MAKIPTSIRLDAALKKKVARLAKEQGLRFSDVVELLLHSYAKGEVYIGAVQIRFNDDQFAYPKEYLEKIHKEIEETNRSYENDDVKSYDTADEVMNALLQDSEQYMNMNDED